MAKSFVAALAALALTSAFAFAQEQSPAASSPESCGTTTASDTQTTAQAHKTHHGEFDPGDRYTDALNLLESHGYAHIANLAEDGAALTATAERDGRTVKVRVDSAAGTVQDQG